MGNQEQEVKTTQESYNNFADQYATLWGENWQQEDSLLVNKFLSSVKPGGTILDVGCGTGHILAYMEQQGFDVIGVDTSDGMLAEAANRIEVSKLFHMDAQQLQFPDNTFDGLISRFVLQHIQGDIAQPFGEFYRVVRNGSLLYVVAHVSNTEEPQETWYELPNGGKIKMFYRDPETVGVAAKQSGFRIETQNLTQDEGCRNLFMLLRKEII